MLERINEVFRARFRDESVGDGADDQTGFTLVELLIVVVVLGILAAVTVFGLSGTTATSDKAACNADARSVEIAVEAFHASDAPAWPASVLQLTQVDPLNPGIVYLRTVPSSTKYTIALDATGQKVLVNGADYDVGVNTGANPCNAVP